MSKIIFKPIMMFFCLSFAGLSYAQADWEWVNTVVVPSGTEQTIATASATDHDDNVYVAIQSNAATLTFGSLTFTNTIMYSFTFYLVKYNSDGDVLWVETAPVPYLASIEALDVDNEGNIYALGHFLEEVSFDDITLTSSNYNHSMFLAKFDSTGETQWARKAEANGTFEDMFAFPSDIAVGAGGNIYVSGGFIGENMTFDSVTVTVDTEEGRQNYFLASYDEDGNILWAKKAETDLYGGTCRLETDPTGNVYAAGSYFGAFAFDTDTLSSPGLALFVALFDSSGVIQWIKSYDDAVAADITCNSLNKPLVVGTFTAASVSFDSFDLYNSGSYDLFVAAFNTDGSTAWVNGATGTGFDTLSGIAADLSNNVYISGRTNSPQITFGTNTLTNSGTNLGFITKLDSSGQYVWTATATEIVPLDLSIDTQSGLYLSGYFSDMATFDPITVSTDADTTFLAKLTDESLSANRVTGNFSALYPNPAKDTICIGSNSATSFYINDMSGRIITSGSAEDGTIDVSFLQPGIYLLNAMGRSEKFIKK